MKTETIILSIHPIYIEKMLSGEKRYEYRKQIPTNVRYIVVYATAPIKKIVAIIEIDYIMKDNPKIIWEKTKEYSGVSQDFFMHYFANHQDSYAIKIKQIFRLMMPKPLVCLDNNISAPQSYKYLERTIEELSRILEIKTTTIL